MMQRLAHRNPERATWVVLWLAFILFVVLAVGIPLSVRWYLLNATQPQRGALEFITGMVTVREPRAAEPITLTASRDLAEGARIRTGSDSRANLTFFESSTMLLYGETEATVRAMRRPRFSLSPHPDAVLVDLHSGLARISVAASDERDREVIVRVPGGETRLLPGGSYSIQVGDGHSQVVTRYGEAMVLAGSRGVWVEQGQRVDMHNGELGPTLPAAQNLIANGNFRDLLETSWSAAPYSDLEGIAPGDVEIVDQGDRRAAYFVRMGAEEGVHTEVSIEQTINRDVRDLVSLLVRLDVRLEYQSLPGAGYRSSEFPIMVELKYRDAYGRDLSWYHGFYYRDPPPNWPLRNGEKIPAFIWYPYESEDLVELLGDARPVHIHSLRIYASGWNYRAMVSEVGLIAE
ncbi:MAG: FecR domain-containing protein [Chloroflexi bacterium]|nr:FecR domain-containing protein [Chloroflexota bacterium]